MRYIKTEKAEINKTTFYAHYETLPDLVNTLEAENIDYIINNLDQVQLLFTNSDFFIDNLYRNLKDCNIAKISQSRNRNVTFLQKLKEQIENFNSFQFHLTYDLSQLFCE